MHFKDEKHRASFIEATTKLDSKNHALLSAVYLLTAERRLWNSAEPCASRNAICFERLRLKNCTESEYALCCAAKDLYLGTKNLTIADLADNTVIDPQTFRLICAAMAIRRLGAPAVEATRITLEDFCKDDTTLPHRQREIVDSGGIYAVNEIIKAVHDAGMGQDMDTDAGMTMGGL